MTGNERAKLGAILLAAGGSSRLGRPKQLVKFEDESLLRRAARALADSVYFPIVVVLGFESEASAAEIAGLPVYQAINADWQSGMSSSIRTGLARLLDLEPDLDGALIAVCDQPRVSTEMLNGFAAGFSANTPVITAAYDETVGVPALFSSELFGQLQELTGDKGARDLIRSRSDILIVNLPAAAFDIDTTADLDQLG